MDSPQLGCTSLSSPGVPLSPLSPSAPGAGVGAVSLGPPQIAETPLTLQSQYLCYEDIPRPKPLKATRTKCDKENDTETMDLTVDTSEHVSHVDLKPQSCGDILPSTYHCRSEGSAFHPLLPAGTATASHNTSVTPLRPCSANHLAQDMQTQAIGDPRLPRSGYRLRLHNVGLQCGCSMYVARVHEFGRPLSVTSECRGNVFLWEPSPPPRPEDENSQRPRNPTPLTAARGEPATVLHVTANPDQHPSCWRRLRVVRPSTIRRKAQLHQRRHSPYSFNEEQQKRVATRPEGGGVFVSAARRYLVGLPDILDMACDPQCRLLAQLSALTTKPPPHENCPATLLDVTAEGLRCQSCVAFSLHQSRSLEDEEPPCGSGGGLRLAMLLPSPPGQEPVWTYPELDLSLIERN